MVRCDPTTFPSGCSSVTARGATQNRARYSSRQHWSCCLLVSTTSWSTIASRQVAGPRVDTTPRSYKHETRLIRTFRPCPIQPDHERDPDSCPICPPSIARHRTAFRTFGLHFRVTSVYVIVLPHPPGTCTPTSRRLYQAYSISPRTFPVKPISRYRRLLYMVVSLRQ